MVLYLATIWYFCFITSICAMEVENRFYISLKNLIRYIGFARTKELFSYKNDPDLQTNDPQEYAWKETIEVPDFSIIWFAHNANGEKQQITKNLYDFVQELEDAVPKDVYHYIGYIGALGFTAKGKRLYAQSYTHYATLKHNQGTSAMIVAPNTRKLFTGGFDCTIRCWDLNDYTYQYELKGHAGYITCFAIGTKPHLLLSVGADTNYTVKCWDTTTKECFFSLNNLTYVSFVTSNSTANTITYASINNDIFTYNIESQAKIMHQNNNCTCLNYCRCTDVVKEIILDMETNTVICGFDDHITIKNEQDKKSTFPIKMTSLFKQPNATMIYAGDFYHAIHQLDIAKQACTKKYEGHKDATIAMTYDTRHDLLISGARDATIKIWHPETTQCLATYTHEHHNTSLKNVTQLAYDDKTGTIISGSYDANSTIAIWKPSISINALHLLTPKEWLIVEALSER